MTLNIISLGAGVQSTCLALMAAHGEITPMPDCAIFADTQDEPQAVYEHLGRLTKLLPFPVHVVTAGRLSDAMYAGQDKGRIPFHFASGLGRRQCTKKFKLAPIRRKLREMLGKGQPRPGAVSMWIGISLDEAMRMKPAHVAYITNRWPLVERRISRQDCLRWLERHGYPEPPKSACVYCPYRKTAQWGEMKRQSPSDFARAVHVDRRLRDPDMVKLYRGEQFIHWSCQPLDQVDLSTPEDRGQLNLFLNECEGMCGV